MTFDVNLGQLAITAGLGVVGWSLKRLDRAVRGFVSRVELHGEVINEHSDILQVKGLSEGRIFRRVK